MGHQDTAESMGVGRVSYTPPYTRGGIGPMANSRAVLAQSQNYFCRAPIAASLSGQCPRSAKRAAVSDGRTPE